MDPGERGQPKLALRTSAEHVANTRKKMLWKLPVDSIILLMITQYSEYFDHG
jgi:hypothetical protein